MFLLLSDLNKLQQISFKTSKYILKPDLGVVSSCSQSPYVTQQYGVTYFFVKAWCQIACFYPYSVWIISLWKQGAGIIKQMLRPALLQWGCFCSLELPRPAASTSLLSLSIHLPLWIKKLCPSFNIIHLPWPLTLGNGYPKQQWGDGGNS